MSSYQDRDEDSNIPDDVRRVVRSRRAFHALSPQSSVSRSRGSLDWRQEPPMQQYARSRHASIVESGTQTEIDNSNVSDMVTQATLTSATSPMTSQNHSRPPLHADANATSVPLAATVDRTQKRVILRRRPSPPRPEPLNPNAVVEANAGAANGEAGESPAAAAKAATTTPKRRLRRTSIKKLRRRSSDKTKPDYEELDDASEEEAAAGTPSQPPRQRKAKKNSLASNHSNSTTNNTNKAARSTPALRSNASEDKLEDNANNAAATNTSASATALSAPERPSPPATKSAANEDETNAAANEEEATYSANQTLTEENATSALAAPRELDEADLTKAAAATAETPKKAAMADASTDTNAEPEVTVSATEANATEAETAAILAAVAHQQPEEEKTEEEQQHIASAAPAEGEAPAQAENVILSNGEANRPADLLVATSSNPVPPDHDPMAPYRAEQEQGTTNKVPRMAAFDTKARVEAAKQQSPQQQVQNSAEAATVPAKRERHRVPYMIRFRGPAWAGVLAEKAASIKQNLITDLTQALKIEPIDIDNMKIEMRDVMVATFVIYQPQTDRAFLKSITETLRAYSFLHVCKLYPIPANNNNANAPAVNNINTNTVITTTTTTAADTTADAAVAAAVAAAVSAQPQPHDEEEPHEEAQSAAMPIQTAPAVVNVAA